MKFILKTLAVIGVILSFNAHAIEKSDPEGAGLCMAGVALLMNGGMQLNQFPSQVQAMFNKYAPNAKSGSDFINKCVQSKFAGNGNMQNTYSCVDMMPSKFDSKFMDMYFRALSTYSKKAKNEIQDKTYVNCAGIN